MATLSSSLPIESVLGFQRSKIKAVIPAISILKFRSMVPSTRLCFRFEIVGNSQVKQRLSTVFANPKESEIVEGKSEGSETGGAKGPPFLTILAGFVVFFFICWLLGSIVMWLIGLIR